MFSFRKFECVVFIVNTTETPENLTYFIISKIQRSIIVTSTSQHQIFDEKFDQGPESVRIKMAVLAGR